MLSVIQLDEAMTEVVGRRLVGWYGGLVFSRGSIVTTTGFMIYGLIDSNTKDQIKHSITDTLSNDANSSSYEVDHDSITIVRQYIGQYTQYWTSVGLYHVERRGAKTAKVGMISWYIRHLIAWPMFFT